MCWPLRAFTEDVSLRHLVVVFITSSKPSYKVLLNQSNFKPFQDQTHESFAMSMVAWKPLLAFACIFTSVFLRDLGPSPELHVAIFSRRNCLFCLPVSIVLQYLKISVSSVFISSEYKTSLLQNSCYLHYCRSVKHCI